MNITSPTVDRSWEDLPVAALATAKELLSRYGLTKQRIARRRSLLSRCYPH